MAKKIKEGWILAAVAVVMAAALYMQRHPGYSWERDLSQRIAVDFNRTQEEVKSYISQYLPDVTDEQIEAWTKAGKLESMQIGGRTMYFHAAAPNLFRIDPELAALKASRTDGGDVSKSGTPLDGHEAVDAVTIPAIRRGVEQALSEGTAATGNPYLAEPRRMRVTFTLTVPAYTLRPGKRIRCWLPYPRTDTDRQGGIRFIEAGVDGKALPADRITFSDPSCAHSSLYMEGKAHRDRPTTFHEVFEYTSSGEWHPMAAGDALPYRTDDEDYRRYTAEEGPHLRFSERIRHLADSLTAGITDPYLQALAFFTWIDGNFPWASAREYSTIPNIPEYVLDAGHGDCGQKTLLLMALCRCKGIPIRWQSGLMMHPGSQNLHDWAEIYFEGKGWMPVDQSFGITPYGGTFFLGGIEPYRMVVNNGFAEELSPKKKFPRSDNVDFQRGEVEWDYGNLYFNQWSYHFDIEYLD